MSDAWLFFLGVFASYFVTWVAVESAIAAPLVNRVRVRLERRWIAQRAAVGSPEEAQYAASEIWNSKLAYLLSCIPCLGFWVSGVCTVVLSVAYGLDYPVIAWLAMSGIVGLIGRFDRN